MKANTAALSIPAKLANSTYLKDLSTVTGNDLVGPSLSASTLGLANAYTISLFTSCAENEDCTSPHFGFHFNPVTELNLDGTGVQSAFPSSFIHTISTYGTNSTALAVAYILAFAFTVVTPIFTLFSSRSPRATTVGVITSFLAMLFLLAASSVALATFSKVKDAFNSNLETIGVKTALGNKLFVFSWVATVFSSITLILLSHNMRVSARQRRHGNGLLDQASIDKGGEGIPGPASGGLKKLSLLQRMPTWRKHNYSQIEKQPAVKTAVTGVVYDASDRDILLTRGFGGGDDIEDEEEHEFVQGHSRGIQLQPMGRGATRDLDTAYEPYRSQAGAGTAL